MVAHTRYVAIELGRGSFVPHDADTVIAKGYGDCKDHDVLLQALLKAKGIDAESILINATNAYSLSEAPSFAQLDHVITYLPEFAVYLDASTPVAPFDVLPLQEYGKPAVRASRKTAGLERLYTFQHEDGGWGWWQTDETHPFMTAYVLAGGTLAVTIVGTMPAALTEGWQGVLGLKAQAVNPITGALEANTVSAISNNGTISACTSDIVLGDGAGQDDAARDGIQSARSGYIVHLANISVTKTSYVYCDPLNGCGAGAKAIPGATVEYTVVVKNTGASAPTAQSVTISLTRSES